ncbi:hypothetical protein V1525DRAFT_415974 [Lipomyces kononenkoae]|uniref:Uncharacterized protein n=1 Tax=Lipomyces kononenkoae TaxID=34357 RepID=A0ACC3TBT7_LIPKO
MSTVAIPTVTFLPTSGTRTSEQSNHTEQDFNMEQPVHSDIDMLASEDDDEMLLDEDAQGEHGSSQIPNAPSSPPGWLSRMEEDERDGGSEIVTEEVDVEDIAHEEDEQLLDADGSTLALVAVEEEVHDEVLGEADAENTDVGRPFVAESEETQSAWKLPAEETATEHAAVEEATEVPAAEPDAKDLAAPEIREETSEVVENPEVPEVPERDVHLSAASTVIEDQHEYLREDKEAETIIEPVAPSVAAAENEQENQQHVPLGHADTTISQEPDTESAQTTDEARSVRTDFPDICVVLRKDDRNYLLCPSDGSDELIADLGAQTILEDYTILSQPLVNIFALLRSLFSEELAEDCELVLDVPHLGLSVAEDNVFCNEVTIYDLVELYSGLRMNDGDAAASNEPLLILVNAQVRFLHRFNHIAELIRQGKGLQYLYDEDASATSRQNPQYHANGVSAVDEETVLDKSTTDLKGVSADSVEADISSIKQEVPEPSDARSESLHAEATPEASDVAYGGEDYQEQEEPVPAVISDAGAADQTAVPTTGDAIKFQELLPKGEDLSEATSPEGLHELNPPADVLSDEKGASKRTHETLDDDDEILRPEDKRVKSVSE